MTPRKAIKKFISHIAEKRRFCSSLCIVAVVLIYAGAPAPLNAGGSVFTLRVVTENPPTAQLTITPASVNFRNSVAPLIPAQENPVSVTANAQIDDQSTAVLSVFAGDDLVSGADKISIDKVSWTATGDGFVAGTMKKNVSVTAGSWQGPGEHVGTFSFFLANSWSYATGNYSQTVIYTLTAP
jgi:hypothetical protein